MSRFKAFAIHFAISLAIFVFLAYLVLAHWYPDFFFDSDGGWQGIRIIVLVDLVLGPLLTLVVYKAGKPGLKFDLSMIALVQTLCLIAGVWVVYSERPIALVYHDGYFFSLSRDSWADAELPVPDLSEFPGPTPKRVMVSLPEDLEEVGQLRLEAMQGKSLRLRADFYKPLSLNPENLVREAAEHAELRERDGGSGQLLKWQVAHGPIDDFAFLKFGARYGYYFLGVDRDSHEIIDVLKMNPKF